jgi:hypothetical protein
MFDARWIAPAALSIAVFAAPCQAQIVRIGGFGGVSVRAPFVGVDVFPYGPTIVRAPFTRVYSSGLPYGPIFPYRHGVIGVPVFPPVASVVVVPSVPVVRVPVLAVPSVPSVVFEEEPILPQGYQVTRPSLDGHVSEDLRRAAIELQFSLSRRHDGDVWLDYLAPGRIIQSIEQGEDPNSLRDLIMNYDGVVANGSLRPIHNALGFNQTRELLRVYVDLPASLRQSGSQRIDRSLPAPPTVDSPAAVSPATADGSEELPAPQGVPAPGDESKPTPPLPPPPPPLPEPPDVAIAPEPIDV